MTRLPQPGSDNSTWGSILNDFLSISNNSDGTLQLGAISSAGGYTKPNIGIPAGDLAGNIPLSLFDASTQTILNSVTSKYVKPSSGIPVLDLSSGVQASLAKADTAMQPGDAVGADLGGTLPNPTVVKIQGVAVNGSTPSNGQVLSYDTGASQWVPSTVSSTTVSDATTVSKGIIQLTGDLGGFASAPTVTSTHLISALPVNQGGTGSASQNFVDLSTSQTIGGVKNFTGGVTVPAPSVGTDAATKSYVDSQITGGATPDATSSIKGKVKLAGDLAGTADLPTVPGLSTKAADNLVVHLASDESITGNKDFTGVLTHNSKAIVDTSDTRLSDARDLKAATSSVSFNSQKAINVADPTLAQDAATKAYVDSQVTGGATPDATSSIKGKVQLAGDLGGAGSTAGAPVVTDGAITASKIASGAVTTSKLAVGSVTSNVIADGTIADVDIASSAAIAKSKLASLSIVDADVVSISSSKISGLGGAAILNVGSTAGTVAAGDDSRLVGVVSSSLLTTKGDMFAATAANTPSRLSAGSDGSILTADSSQTTGLRWGTHVVGGGNYITNPSFDDGINGWTAGSGSTLSINNLNGLFDANCGSVVRASTTGTLSIVSPRSLVSPSLAYSASASFRLGTLGTSTARAVSLQINWYTAVDSFISSQTSASVNESIQGTWATISLPNSIAPDTAAKVEIQVNVGNVPTGEAHYFDGFQLEPGSLPTSFNANFPQSSITGNALAPLTVTSRETATGSAKPFYGTTASLPSAGTIGRLYWATDTNSLYFDNGTSWVVVNAGGSASLDGMYDFPFTIDPRLASGFSALTANNVYYFRLQGAATIAGLALHIGTTDNTQSINLGIYTNAGSGRSAKPGSLVSGSTATITLSASTGFYSSNFASNVAVQHGQWVGLSSTSSTATFFRVASNTSTALTAGLAWFQSGGGPTLPSSPGTLFNFLLTPVIVGI